MILTIYAVMALFFAFGAWATNRRHSGRKDNGNEDWIKYRTYLIIVVFLSAFIFLFPAYFHMVIALIVLAGYYEIIRAFLKNPTLKNPAIILISALVVYSALAGGLFLFSIQKKEILIVVFLTVTTFDGFSQISGQLFGRRPVLRTVSPNKTIEGLIGGTSMGTLATILMRSLLDLTILQAGLLGLMVCVSAFAGDLLASFYKRVCGIKDYSRLVPGHGGVLDRFDSLFLSGALIGFIGLTGIWLL